MPRSFRARWISLALLLLGAAACPGRTATFEEGAAACSDGQDNDDDGTIDCADLDCRSLAFCAPTDAHVEQQVGDGPRPPDLRPPPDVRRPPDLTAPSSYGRRCTFSGSVAPCADGQSVCLPGKYDSPGFCTRPCGTCPPGPAGTQVSCSLQLLPSGQWYCIFHCPSCPNDLACYGTFCY